MIILIPHSGRRRKMRSTRTWGVDEIRELVLFEDNHLLAMVKPAGMLTQPDRTGDVSLLDLAKRYLKVTYGKPGEVYLGLVHRLDRPVGGVIVFARTSKAARRLSEQFRGRTARKIYWALVEGAPDPPEGELVHRLIGSGTMMRAAPPDTPEGQEARLAYRTLERARGASLVEVELITGRKHQIRAQLAAIGCPVVGDIKYGAKRLTPGRREERTIVGAIRLFARSLVFSHPVTGRDVTVEAKPPEAFFSVD
jgi:23S rRNA pseudouridine1911/1915/1917 synthase